jgi:hypothetical protein
MIEEFNENEALLDIGKGLLGGTLAGQLIAKRKPVPLGMG